MAVLYLVLAVDQDAERDEMAAGSFEKHLFETGARGQVGFRLLPEPRSRALSVGSEHGQAGEHPTAPEQPRVLVDDLKEAFLLEDAFGLPKNMWPPGTSA